VGSARDPKWKRGDGNEEMVGRKSFGSSTHQQAVRENDDMRLHGEEKNRKGSGAASLQDWMRR